MQSVTLLPSHTFNLEDYISIIPVALTVAVVFTRDLAVPVVPPPIKRLLAPFIALEHIRNADELGVVPATPVWWKRWGLCGLVGGELAMNAFFLSQAILSGHEILSSETIRLGSVCACWLYMLVRFTVRPPVVASYSLLILAGAQLSLSSYDALSTLASPATSPAEVALALAATIPLLVVFRLLMSYPLLQYNKPDASFSPEDFVTVWEWSTFSWISPLLAAGKARKLEEADVWSLSPFMKTEAISRRFRELKRPSLVWTIVRTNSLDLCIFILLNLTSAILAYVAPFLLNRILTTIALTGDSTASNRHALVLATLAFLANVLKSQADLYQLYHSRRAATRARSGLIAEIYRKALCRRDLSGGTAKQAKAKGAKKEGAEEKKDEEEETSAGADVGKIVNLMSGDASSISNALLMLGILVSAPFELVIALFFLYSLLGWTSLAGLSVIIFAVPFNYLLTRYNIKVEKQLRAAKDDRMSLVTEIIESCRTLKYFAWEKVWLGKVIAAREVELKWLVYDRLVGMGFGLLWTLVPDMITLICFFCFTKIAGEQLTVPIAFTAVAVFQQLRMPLNYLPNGIVSLLQTYVSVKRIEGFLAEPEVGRSSLDADPLSTAEGPETRIGFDKATFRWASNDAMIPKGEVAPSILETMVEDVEGTATRGEQKIFELRDLDITFPLGSMSLITGATGSGKTALLHALLGELDCLAGRHYLPKSIHSVNVTTGLYNGTAYSSQTPWLEHATIRNNILFGSPYEQERYDEVLKVCALGADLVTLEDGDMTEIGERGVSLSGGQKARVALARAVYSRAKHLLLDDPLSAVDSHTAHHLYMQCFCGPLLQGRTIILVTHHVDLCRPSAALIVNVNQGVVTLEDTSAQLSITVTDTDTSGTTTLVPTPSSSNSIDGDATGLDAKLVTAAAVPKVFVKDEARAEGSVRWRIYRTYLDEVGYVVYFFLLVFILLEKLVPLAQQFWLKEWSESYKSELVTILARPTFSTLVDWRHNMMATVQVAISDPMDSTIVSVQSIFPPANENVDPYLWVYFGIGIMYAVISQIYALISLYGTITAARSLFGKSIHRVVHAPSRWFDTTPLGRTLNRFGSDFDTIDWRLSMSVTNTVETITSLSIALSVIIFVVPPFLPPAVLIMCLYAYLSYAYIRCSRDLRRMMSNSRSPIFANFAETLNGIVVIRAFSREQLCLEGLYTRVDKFTSFDYSFWMANRYLLLRFDVLGAAAIFLTTVIVVLSGASAGLAALAIVSAQSLVMSIYWLCRFFSLLEVDLNSVERIDELLQTEQEPAAIIENHRPAASWPSSTGSGISIEKLVIKYAPDLPSVIKGISVEFQPRSKVGIVGRTGSGKSSFAMSLLRFVDPTEGKIIIDGIDIATIGLSDLRSKLTTIAQDPVLFAGTIRTNLDPMSDHSDEELWAVLDRVQLSSKSSGTATPVAADEAAEGTGRISIQSLDMQVAKGGQNFSQGQRQLLAMARALLRMSSIVIMDEATASVDFATDEIIQATIREEFSNSLVITIAHRLRTVIHCDAILVLDAGEIVEFASPATLLRDPESAFRAMCAKSADWDEIKSVARLDL